MVVLPHRSIRLMGAGLVSICLGLSACSGGGGNGDKDSDQQVPAPQTTADQYSVEPGQTLTIDAENGVLSNDVSERDLTASLTDSPQKAADFEFFSDGSFSYTAAENVSGSDSFTYSASDGERSHGPQQVTIEIDTRPLSGQDDSYSVVSGTTLILSGPNGILANDAGTFGAEVLLQKRPEQAIDFSLGPDGQLLYRTVTDTAATDSFSYRLIEDGANLGPFMVTLNISQPDISEEAPGAYDQCESYTSGQTVSSTLQAAGISNPSFELLSEPALGVLTSFDAGSGQFSYARSSRARGADSFSYRIRNAEGAAVAEATMELIETPYRIMPVGDSITSGVEFYDSTIGEDTPDSNTRVGYRKFLKDSLTAAGYEIDLVGLQNEGAGVQGFADTQHNGYPGESLSFGRDNMLRWLNNDEADILLIHMGTNGTSAELTSPALWRKKAMLDNVDSWEASGNFDVVAMVARLITRTDNNAARQAINNYNDLLDDLVTERKNAGDWIYIVDQNTAFGNGDLLSADRLHPTLAGYQVMSDTWIARLEETGVLRKCE